MGKIRFLVIDRYPVFREGLRYVSRKEKDIECVGTAENCEEGIKLAKKLVPDVVLIDIDMPKVDAIETIRQVREACPTTAIAIITHIKAEHSIIACLKAGVNGYLLKDAPIRDLMNAIRFLHGGESVFNFEVITNILHSLGDKQDGNLPGLGQLHNREQDVLRLAARGISNNEIAYDLGISEHTVATHFFNIYRKLGVQSRTAAVLHALKQGWLSIDDMG